MQLKGRKELGLSNIPDVLPRVINDLWGGEFVLEASEALQVIVHQVEATRKPGELTLKIKVTPRKGGQISMNGKIDGKCPEDDGADILLYTTPEGNVTRRNPHQTELTGIRDITPATDAREIEL